MSTKLGGHHRLTKLLGHQDGMARRSLFVSPAGRKTGVGKALLQYAAQFAKAQGASRMDLTTARSNLAAQALYASLGWKLDEVFLAYNLDL